MAARIGVTPLHDSKSFVVLTVTSVDRCRITLVRIRIDSPIRCRHGRDALLHRAYAARLRSAAHVTASVPLTLSGRARAASKRIGPKEAPQRGGAESTDRRPRRLLHTPDCPGDVRILQETCTMKSKHATAAAIAAITTWMLVGGAAMAQRPSPRRSRAWTRTTTAGFRRKK